jgi:hypothetical protein
MMPVQSPCQVAARALAPRFQTATAQSSLAVISQVSSLVTATACIGAWWPVKDRSPTPVFRSQTIAVWSSLVVTARVPSPVTATALTHF